MTARASSQRPRVSQNCEPWGVDTDSLLTAAAWQRRLFREPPARWQYDADDDDSPSGSVEYNGGTE